MNLLTCDPALAHRGSLRIAGATVSGGLRPAGRWRVWSPGVWLLLLWPLSAACSGAWAALPLAPLDTSSPRATMASFLGLTDAVAERYLAYRDAPTPATEGALRQAVAKAPALFDLDAIAPAAQRQVGAKSFLLLWEVVSRLPLPPLQDIPDEGAAGADGTGSEPPARWRLPGTDVVIMRVTAGPRAGEFLFSAATVAQLPELFEDLRGQPYVRPVPMRDLHLAALLMTGWMIPLSWTAALPDWARQPLFGLVVWKGLALILLAGLSLGLAFAVTRWVWRRPREATLGSSLRHLIPPLTVLLLGFTLRGLLGEQIMISGDIANATLYVIDTALGAALVWLVWLLAFWGGEALVARPHIGQDSLHGQLIRLAVRTGAIVVTLMLGFRVANDLGVPVAGLVAGAGVGGLAIALAAKSTLENFMGALNLFADQPVRVGDLCRFDESHDGEWLPTGRVESIGLRSTRIRRADRALITIPNAEFAQRNIVNLSACDRMLLTLRLGLRYETTPDQLRFLLAELRALLHAHPRTIHTADDPLRVRLTGFGDYALLVDCRAYLNTRSYNEFLALKEDLLLRILALVQRAGTGFAFPSQTVYRTTDTGLDDEAQARAEQTVQEWVAAGTLPFPELDEAERRRITDTLDYPPAGSAAARAPHDPMR